MSVLVVRHGFSEVNISGSHVNQKEAHLTDLGRSQARRLGHQLTEIYGIKPEQPVAVSRMLRTHETAIEAGFANYTSYAVLDEVGQDKGWADIMRLMRAKQLPTVALKKAEAILEQPPEESILFSHGFVIASLCAVLGVHQEKRLIPDFCEIRELQI